jgi:anthranilate phosphoribosyltransferase
MFAPYFHRLSPVLAEVRRSLGHPTIFNILGPLCNPAGATHHLIGVWDAGLVDVVAQVMARLGTERSWVVHGTDGLDEITLSGETDVAEITDGRVKRFQVSPEVFGAKASSTLHLRAATPAASAEYLRNVLYKNDGDTTASDLVKTSAAAAIHIVNGDSFERAFSAAGESIDSGAAAAKLRDLVRMTNQ